MKVIITEQANGLYSIYTNTGKDSMADEELLHWGLSWQDVIIFCDNPLVKCGDFTVLG